MVSVLKVDVLTFIICGTPCFQGITNGNVQSLLCQKQTKKQKYLINYKMLKGPAKDPQIKTTTFSV